MQPLTTIADLQTTLGTYRQQSETVALVPTMGNLHAGHLSLVQLARQYADKVVVSIFVNPTQFGAGEDFDSYPRTLLEDLALLDSLCDCVFAPSVDEMYPTNPPTVQVSAGDLTKDLCGKSRPNHFDGVGMVVSKLFNIVRPNVAIFGSKDYQQLRIIQQINDELNFGIDLIAAPIVREPSGLALSSRNRYLTDEQKMLAPLLYESLQQLAADIQRQGIKSSSELIAASKAQLTQAGFGVDYLQLRNEDLTVPAAGSKNLVLLTAAMLGKARLLDNVAFVLP